jgi:hypothetical protein
VAVLFHERTDFRQRGTLLRHLVWPIIFTYSSADTPDEIRHAAITLMPLALSTIRTAITKTNGESETQG